MHEASLVEALFDQVDESMRSHPAGRLRLVRVCIGELAGVEPQLFRTAFEVLRVPRGHSDAALEITHEDAEWTCPACRTRVARGGVLLCATCGGSVDLLRGGDIVLARMELEAPHV